MDTCALCGERAVLQMSHILPSFVFAWMKRTSATGHIRFGMAPNRRVQDGLKVPLLGECCEQRIASWEKEFAERVFHPIHDADVYEGFGPSPASPIEYGPWLLKFAVSVSWRSLVFVLRSRGIPEGVTDSLRPKVAAAEAIWREFLLNERPNPAQYEQHMVLFGPIEHTTLKIPSNMNRYLLRAPEIDIVFTSKSVFIYSKLCRAVVFGFIEMPQAKKWTGTKLHVNAGRVPDGRIFMDQAVIDYMMARARRLEDLTQSMSPAQRQRIEDAFKRDPNRVLSSDSVRARNADIELHAKRLSSSERPSY